MTHKLALVVAAVGMTIAGQTALGQTTYTLQTSGVWGDDENWSPQGGPPGEVDTAVIPANKTCTVANADQDAARIEIGMGGLNGLLVINSGRTLTLHGHVDDSEVNGDFNIEGTLEIASDLTISGSLGLMRGTGAGGSIAGVAGAVLTIEDGPVFDFWMGGNLDVEVELVNNAHVVVQASTVTLTLKTNPKSGSGLWRAFDGGTLKVDVEVTGSGIWVVDSLQSSGGTIEINAECTDLTGNFSILAGTLDVNENLCTTGSLSFKNATIDVAATKFAHFAGASCAT